MISLIVKTTGIAGVKQTVVLKPVVSLSGLKLWLSVILLVWQMTLQKFATTEALIKSPALTFFALSAYLVMLIALVSLKCTQLDFLPMNWFGKCPVLIAMISWVMEMGYFGQLTWTGNLFIAMTHLLVRFKFRCLTRNWNFSEFTLF